jgi:hypothetical protein
MRASSLRRDIGGKTVRLDGVGHGSQLVGREAGLSSKVLAWRPPARGLRPVRVILRQIDQIVQIAGRQHHQGISLRVMRQDVPRSRPYPVKVRQIMGTVGIRVLLLQ